MNHQGIPYMTGVLLKVFNAVLECHERSNKWPTQVDVESDLTVSRSACLNMLKALECLNLIQRKWDDERVGQRMYVFVIKDWVLEEIDKAQE